MSEIDPVQQTINEKLGVKSKGAQIPATPPKTIQPQLSQASIRQLTPEENKSFLASAKVQIFVVCGVLIIGAIAIKQIAFGSKASTTVIDPIKPVQATTAIDCDNAVFKSDPRCIVQENAKLKAQNDINNKPSLYEKTPQKPPTTKNTIPVNKLPVAQTPPTIYPQQPQRTFSQPAPIAPQPAIRRSFQPSYQSQPIVRAPRFVQPSKPKTDPEALWRQLSTDGITIAQGNSSFVPVSSPTATEASYVSESQPISLVPGSSFATPQASTYPQNYPQNYPQSTPSSGPVVGSGEGKLLDPIVWAPDFDISGQEFPIQITKAVGNLTKGAIVYVQLDGNSSGSGLVNLRATRSDQGDVTGLKIMATSGAPLQAKIKGRGGNGFLGTVGNILLGGVQVAANQALSDSNDVLSSVGSGVASSALSNVRSNLNNGRRGQGFFEIPKGTTVKITAY